MQRCSSPCWYYSALTSWGEGFEVALPRVVDTLIGCAIAWAAVSFIWPDWRFRNLPRVLQRATDANCRYLDAILEQYHQGRITAWPIALPDATRTTAMQNWHPWFLICRANPTSRLKPGRRRSGLLCLNHTFTSYISALGAHREKLSNPDVLGLLDDAVCYVDDALHHQPEDEQRVTPGAGGFKAASSVTGNTSGQQRTLVVQQIGLLIALLPEIGRLQRQISPPTSTLITQP
ncbi:Putative efflux (PET) family inner membrane protein YccS [Salmonella enterica subsp. enterica]|uniref:Efflux (PET) family inner membrane protein YccS n=1 Tax=Salmonella enterica I TaxID=59201 RepID=A0A379WCF7_SALET|nr:Putative efflux (PET) family inner membrane protein YccS [Salmonella enterica subsp. enterica]